MKKIILLLILTWVLIIFMFSNQDGNISKSTSKHLINKCVIVTERIFNVDLDNKSLVNDLNYFVRRFAHIFEYFILGLLIYYGLFYFNIDRRFIYSIILCFILASFDELHQLLMVDRTSSLLDVIFDTSSSILSICLIKKYKF